MEKICYDDSTSVWKIKLKMSNLKGELLKQAMDVIANNPSKADSHTYVYEKVLDRATNFLTLETKNNFDKICNTGVSLCQELYDEKDIQYSNILLSSWVNVLRSKHPIQPNFTKKGRERYHTHTELNKLSDSFEPVYTFVYYIQMPEIMNNDDGVLQFLGKNDREYQIRPEEDDLIIMPGDIPHFPKYAPSSTLDRYVLAGNIGFSHIKQQKTLL